MNLPGGALGNRGVAECRLQQPRRDHGQDAGDEQIGRHREQPPRLTDPTQIHRGQQRHEPQIHRHPVRTQCRYRGDDVVHAGRHRHGHRHHVVHHQRRGHHQPRPRPQVAGGHLVRAPAGGVSLHHLPVGQHHHRQQHHHRGRHPWRQVQIGQPAQRQHQQDLLRRVRHRRQRVTGKNRQGNPLGQHLLTQTVTTEGAAHNQPLERYRHNRQQTGPTKRRPNLRAALTPPPAIFTPSWRDGPTTAWPRWPAPGPAVGAARPRGPAPGLAPAWPRAVSSLACRPRPVRRPGPAAGSRPSGPGPAPRYRPCR